MSQDIQQEHVSKKEVVYRIPGMDDVTVRRDVEYRATEAGALTMEIYYPPDFKRVARIPAVVIVAGFPDVGYEAKVGCKFKEMKSSVSWGRLTAASGVVAITYTNHPDAPHAFDLFHDSETSREIVRRILAFMRFHLRAVRAG